MKIQARITIPYAVANYAEMRDRGFYYVDKTDYIPVSYTHLTLPTT